MFELLLWSLDGTFQGWQYTICIENLTLIPKMWSKVEIKLSKVEKCEFKREKRGFPENPF